MKPLIKWPGGKRRLVPQIVPFIGDCEGTYYEPFVGAGAVLLALCPKKAVIGDLNRDLVAVYEAVRDSPDDLLDLLRAYQECVDAQTYYVVRARDREPGFRELPAVERAARLIYLNRTCYNGLYRVNSDGYCNMAYGSYDLPNVADAETVRMMHEYLTSADVSIRAGDFEETLADAREGDAVYLDPPYDGGFCGYTSKGFGRDDQRRLMETARRLSEEGVRVVISNADTPFVRELYSGFGRMWGITASRCIGPTAESRQRADELIICNWEAAA